jgi:hypothetical protein
MISQKKKSFSLDKIYEFYTGRSNKNDIDLLLESLNKNKNLSVINKLLDQIDPLILNSQKKVLHILIQHGIWRENMPLWC